MPYLSATFSEVILKGNIQKTGNNVSFNVKIKTQYKRITSIPHGNDAVTGFLIVHQSGADVSWVPWRTKGHALHTVMKEQEERDEL